MDRIGEILKELENIVTEDVRKATVNHCVGARKIRYPEAKASLLKAVLDVLPEHMNKRMGWTEGRGIDEIAEENGYDEAISETTQKIKRLFNENI